MSANLSTSLQISKKSLLDFLFSSFCKICNPSATCFLLSLTYGCRSVKIFFHFLWLNNCIITNSCFSMANISCLENAFQPFQDFNVFCFLIKSYTGSYLKLLFIIFSWNYLKEYTAIAIKESSDISKHCWVHKSHLPSVLPLLFNLKALGSTDMSQFYFS